MPWQSCCKKKFQAVTLTVVTESTYVQDCVQNLQVFPSTFLAVLSCLNVVLFEGCWIVSSNFEPVEMRSGVCETQTGKKWFKIHFSSSNAISFGPEANKASQQYVLRNSLHGKRILFCNVNGIHFFSPYRYSTKHLNDETTPKNIKGLLM